MDDKTDINGKRGGKSVNKKRLFNSHYYQKAFEYKENIWFVLST